MAPDQELTDGEISALHEALDDEYRAIATYEQVLDDFGEVRPFSNIVEAERRHARAIERIFSRYGLAVPQNPWRGRVPRFSSVRDACAAGVEAEVDNAAMYDRLIAATARPDLLEVFANLRSASQHNHLPAFRRCMQRGQRRG